MKKTLVFVLLAINTSFGQLNDQAYLVEYKKAVQLFANSQYEAASLKFNTLCSKNYTNPIVPYAYYYNALVSKNKGNYYQSRVIFRQLFENFYDWDKINEARIVYAELNFSENYFEEGLKSIEMIQDSQFKSIKNGLLKTFIPKIQSISNLKDLYFKFPTQEIIAKNLVTKIQANRYNSKEDLEISDLLTNRFKFKEIESPKAKTEKKIVKENKTGVSLSYGLLLPFNMEATKNSLHNGSNQYVYDFYAGMKIATVKLATEGIITETEVFDVQKTKLDFLKISKYPELKNIDFFVGPLYAEPNQAAVEFALANKIVQIHPLSNSLSLLKPDKNIFLVQPSYAHQARKAIEYILGKGSKKSLSIYYGSSKKDSLFAEAYRSEAEKKGFNITDFLKYSSGNTLKIASADGHIFFAADNNLGIKFLQLCNKSKINSNLVFTASSFNWDNISKSSFNDKTFIIYPEYVNKNRENVVDFSKKYYESMSTAPSYYSYIGYDMMLYFSRMLKDGLDVFKLNIQAGPYNDDYLLSGFDFAGKQYENNIVPIIKYNGEEFEEVFR
jgi:Periplasmic binding protein